MITIYYERSSKKVMWVKINHEGHIHLTSDVRKDRAENVSIYISQSTLLETHKYLSTTQLEELVEHEVYNKINISLQSIQRISPQSPLNPIAAISLNNLIFKMLTIS